MARSKSTGIARSTDSLVRQLSRHPHLHAYIERLPAPALNRLIDAVGLEDSHEIVARMSPEQLRSVLSVSLWNGARPGREEILDLEQFVRWIGLWLQQGESTLAQRLLDLGEDFVVAALSKLLVAVDRTVVGLEERGVEVGQYLVYPKQELKREEYWHTIVEALRASWEHEPDFVLCVLRRCSFERGILNEDISEHHSAESLYQDIAATRLADRDDLGYVDPTHAAMFLSSAKSADLRTLCARRAYDLNTARYLDSERKGAGSFPERSAEPVVASASEQADFEAMNTILLESGVLQQPLAPPLLIAEHREVPHAQLLEAALADLAESEPDLAARSLGELAFLSNVLISGSEIQGKAFGEREAARVAIATANLGLTFMLRSAAQDMTDRDRIRQWLLEDPGVVRLFEVGYHLSSAIPRRCCEAIYRARDVQARRPGHLILMEMDEVLGSGRLTERVNEGLYGEAKSMIDGLAVAMDSAACVTLRILIDPMPCFPRALDVSAQSRSMHVAKGYRPIATMQDMERIAEFLHALPDYCGD